MQFSELVYNFDYSILELDENISIAYIDVGNKKNENVLLFIHGLSSYIPAWSKLIPLLKNNFRCIAIDLPGYAKSSAGIHSGSMFFYSDVISKFIQKLNLPKVTLVGHSMGGQISIVIALRYSQLLDKLILLAPAGFETFSEEEKKRLKKNNIPQIYASTGDKNIKLNYAVNFFEMPFDAESMIQDRIKMKGWKNFKDYCIVVANSFNEMLNYPVFNDLNKIVLPTLIMYGKNDKFIPQPILHRNLTTETIAKNGASKISNSKLIFVDKCGHFIQFEKAGIVADEITDFFRTGNQF